MCVLMGSRAPQHSVRGHASAEVHTRGDHCMRHELRWICVEEVEGVGCYKWHWAQQIELVERELLG